MKNTEQNSESNLSTANWSTKAFSHPERKIRLATTFSGVGAIEYAFKRLGLNFSIQFAGDINKNCKATYFANNEIKEEQWHTDIHEW